MSLPKEVHIQECCPRDGWQNHAEFIPTDVKIKYIRRMIDCGAKELEVTSFVNPKVMPQMADAAAVFEAIKPYAAEKGCTLSTLALNKRGADDAVAAGSHMLSFVVSASEEHNLRNSRRTIQESMAQFKELASQQTGDVRIQLALPCVFGSPFGDEIPLERLEWIEEEAHSVHPHPHPGSPPPQDRPGRRRSHLCTPARYPRYGHCQCLCSPGRRRHPL